MFIVFICFVSVAPAAASTGLLSGFSNEGKRLFSDSLMNRSSGPVDLSRPLSLLEEPRRTLKFDLHYEQIYRLEKNGVLRSSVSARGGKVFLLYPFEAESPGRGSTVLALDRYSSNISYFNNSGVNDTRLALGGDGGAAAAARKSGRFMFAAYRGTSSLRGGGVSAELNSRAAMLDADAGAALYIKESRESLAVGYKLGGFILSWQDNRFRVPFGLTIADSNDEYFFPVVLSGSSYEAAVKTKLSPSRRLAVYYGEGSAESFDKTRYSVSNAANPNQFANLSQEKFRSYGMGASARLTKNLTFRFELEKYSASMLDAGVLDVLNVVSGLFGNYYNYHAWGELHYSNMRFHFIREGRRYSYALSYSQMPFNGDFHVDGCDKNFFGGCASLMTENYRFRDSRIHTLALGVKAKLGRNANLEYTITQVAPQVNRERLEPPPPPAAPAAAAQPESKKETGGTTHFFSISLFF